jgi:pimeloyl-ACP methyl ester carboxylesterase
LASAALSGAAADGTRALPRADGGTTALRVLEPIGRADAACPPTLVVSHGLGGSAAGASGLAEALAAAGWRVMIMGHAESGPAVLRDAMAGPDGRARLVAAATDPARHRARFADLDATLREATRPCRPARLVLVGHSMGAATAMLEAGAIARFGRFGADRFDAYVAVSPQGVGVFWAEGAWREIRRPVLMITGTRDWGADGPYTTRLSAFAGLPPGPHRLAILEGAGHLELSGTGAEIGRRIGALIEDFLADRTQDRPGVRLIPR